MSAQIVVFAGQKGGVGKTTSAMNLGAAFHEAGARVLLIDLASQGNLTEKAGVRLDDGAPTVYDVLKGAVPVASAIVECGGLDVLPADDQLALIEVEYGGQIGREFLLSRALKAVRDSYDWIMVDCAGGFGLLTMNGLTAATAYVATLETEHQALRSLDALFTVAGQIAEYVNPGLIFAGYLPTKYHGNKNQHIRILEAVKARAEEEGAVVLPTIRENIALDEAGMAGQSIFTFRPSAHAAQDYRAAAEALAVQVKRRG